MKRYDPTKVLEPWYSMQAPICDHLGNTLLKASENLNTNPFHTPYDEWVLLHERHGKALVKYARQLERGQELKLKTYRNAVKALHWIANNLEDLWD